MTRRRLIDGPVLLGFAALFDRAYGDPSTPKPYATIAPARVGDTLLPWPCPRCEAVQSTCQKSRDEYRDPDRGHSWCSSCGLRYNLDINGVPLDDGLPAGVTNAQPRVMRDGEVLQLGNREDDVFAIVGAV